MTSGEGAAKLTMLLLTAAELVSSDAAGERYRGRFAESLRAVPGVRSVRVAAADEPGAGQGIFRLPLPNAGRAGEREVLLVEPARPGERGWSGPTQRDRVESVLVFLGHALAGSALRDGVAAAPMLLLCLTDRTWFPCTRLTADLLGGPADPDRAAGPLTIVDPRDRVVALRAFGIVHSGLSRSARVDLRVTGRTGDALIVDAIFLDLTGVPGIGGIIVAGQDVSRAHADRAAVRELLFRLPYAAFIVGRDGAVVLANRPFAKLTGMFGWAGAGEERALWTVAGQCQDQEDAYRRFRSVLSARRGEAPVALGAGSTLVAERRPLVESGAESGALWTFETREHAATHEPGPARDPALAALAREIRTPATALLTFAGLLADARLGVLAVEQRSAAAVVDRNAGRLVRLADDVLLFTRLDRGDVRIRRTDVDVPALVSEVVGGIAGADIGHRSGQGPRAHADSVLLRQILDYVLDNAVRYGQGGRIRVTTAFAGGWWTVEIADSGMGIPPGELDRVQRPFERGSNAGGIPGSGLGLAIAGELLKAHGGTLRLSSVLGTGTTVAIGLEA